MLRHLRTPEICKRRILKFDFLENEKSFRSELENIFPSLASAFFRLKKQTSISVADTTFKELLRKDSSSSKMLLFNKVAPH